MMFKKKEAKQPKPFTEIIVDINDTKKTKTFKSVKLESVTDNFLVHEGTVYVIDHSLIERARQDFLLETYHGWAKFVRFVSVKRIGYLQFEKGEPNARVEPFRTEHAYKELEVFTVKRDGKEKRIVPLTPILLKGLTNSRKFSNFIHSLKKKNKMEMNKWTLIIIGLLIVAVVILFGTGTIKLPMGG